MLHHLSRDITSLLADSQTLWSPKSQNGSWNIMGIHPLTIGLMVQTVAQIPLVVTNIAMENGHL